MSENAIILNGKYVNNELEQEAYVQNVQTKSDFHLLMEELQKHVPFKQDDLTVKRLYIYDGVAVDTKKFGTGKNITLGYENKVQISSIVAILENQVVEKFYGRVVSADNKNVLVFDVLKGKVNLLFTDKNEGQLEKDIDTSAIHDPAFKPLSTTDAVIQQGLFDFCLKDQYGKKYQHCGKGCGSGSGAIDGGGTPINSIDTCCRAHDRCWDQFGSWDSCCDKILVDCANRYEHVDNATQNQIWLVFAANAAFC
ncbi:hypothetical protein [Solibacillus sp. CAU 1738]|uniref:hypothetical protein n=1 Tax=Solibacillus sp. CAU 1738 TaxID=3140363 RepID=UPI0032609587